MFLKIMSGENAPDGDTRKTFRILDDVTAADFRRDSDGKPHVAVTFRDKPGVPPITETFDPSGNCYLLNDGGDTVAAFGVSPYVPHKGERGQTGKMVPAGGAKETGL